MHPVLPVILDVKRGDIASTAAQAYATACFDALEADAVTASPFLGRDSVESFTSRQDKGVFLLCHTSNPGARDLQELSVDGEPLYLRIARMARSWNSRGTIGLVVGATYAHLLAGVREAAPDLRFLLPGIGAQGGDLEASLEAGLDEGGGKVLVNVSRAIWQARDPASAATEMNEKINACRSATARAGRQTRKTPDLIDRIALGLHDLGAVRWARLPSNPARPPPSTST